MMPIGSIVGAFWSSYLCGMMTPKWALVYVLFIWIFGSVLQVALPFNSLMYIARCLVGVGTGAMSAIMPVYLAEVAPWKNRGVIIGFYQLGIVWGFCAQYLIQYAAMKLSNPHKSVPDRQNFALQLSFGVQLVPGALFFLGIILLPHSPRLYTTFGALGSAISTIAQLHAKGDVNHAKVMAQCREMTEEIRIERERGLPSLHVLLRRPLAKRLCLGVSIQAWSQLCGIDIMMYNLVFVLAGTGAVSPFMMATAQHLIFYGCTALSMGTVADKIGRRRALLAGSLVMMTCLLVTGILQQYSGKYIVGQSIHHPSWMLDSNDRVASAMMALSCFFVAAFAMTWGPISWIYPAEIFPTELRTRAIALCTAARWCCNVTVALSLPHILSALNYKAYYIFAMFNAAALMHMYCTAYETKGHTLEEMHEVFDSKQPAWKFRQRESRIEEMTLRIRQYQQRQEEQRANGISGSGAPVDAQQDGWPFFRR
ncbi:sugar transporter domain-containing protein [Trichoderma austrokoningii]